MGFLQRILGTRGERATNAPEKTPADHRAEEPQEKLAACPHCGVILEPPPPRTRKCPSCRSKIVVRTRRSDSAKLYLTESDAKIFDAERKADAFRNKAIRAADLIGMDKTAFERTEKELLAKSPGYGPSDVFWTLANKLLGRQMRPLDWGGLSNTYFHMALWLYGTGRPYAHLKVEAEKARAQSYARRGLQELEVMGGGCPNCDQFKGRVYPIEQAVNEWPVPSEDCTNGWCLCMWIPVSLDLST